MFRETARQRSLLLTVFLAAILILAALFPVFRVSAGEPEAEIADLSFQTVKTDNIESDETALRFLFTVGSLKYTRVGFVFSKTNANPTVGGDACTVADTTVVYSAVKADGETVEAPAGRYWAAVKIAGIENEHFDTPVYLNAFVEDGAGIRYATADRVTVAAAFGNESNAAAFVPILRFVVASDVHYTESVSEQDDKFHALLTDAYEYSDNHAKYQALDGVFIVGDIAHRGKESELNRFFSDFYAYTRPGTEAQAVLGNHEFWPEAQYAVSRYLAASGYESADRHITIAGYHFILMSPSHYDGFDNAKIAWLSDQLEIAANDDPTGKKPIFVFQHHPAYDTVYGSEDEWGVKNLYPVFSQYPQVVDFSGHSHFPINDPRSIWQGDYTALNTGSCREWGMDLAGVTSKTVFAIGNEGGWSMSEISGELYDPGKYYVIEVDAFDRILVRAFDVGTGAAVIDPVLLSVGDPAKFTCTDDRANTEIIPAFAKDATVTEVSVDKTSATFLFPRVSNGAYVQHYRCEIRRGEDFVNAVYRLDCGFLFPAPETLKLPISNLTPGVNYTVRIIPVTSWENEGEPLVFNFTTAEDVPEPLPELAPVFSATFGADGAATDDVSGLPLRKNGSPETVYDGTQGRYIARFDGNDAYECDEIASYHSVLIRAFTFETYLCMDAKPASGVVAPFSNQEGGGFGFEYSSSGSMDFWIKVNGSWISAKTTVETGNWVHLVATFDGSVLILYRSGSEVARSDASGTVVTPSANHLSIGADSKGNTGSENFAVCQVSVANVYQGSMTAAEVAERYAAVCPGD